MTKEEALEYYQKNFPDDMPLLKISDKIDKLNMDGIDTIRAYLCDNMLSVFSAGFISYGTDYFEKDALVVDGFKKNVRKLPKEEYYLWSMYYYIEKKYDASSESLMKFLKVNGNSETIDERTIITWFLEPFKQGYSGFWGKVAEMLNSCKTADGIIEFCDFLGQFYECKTNEETIELIIDFMRKYPDFKVPRELLANTYYAMGMWNNAIAMGETIEQSVFFYQDDVYFMMAWSYGKIKDYANEEKYYRKCIEIYPEFINANNNLGYCLYKQKRFLEAKDIFEECLQQKKDLPYSANNYVRVLIALGRNADAKKFVNSKEFKISKTIKDRVTKLSNTNIQLKKSDPIPVVNDVSDDESEEQEKSNLTIKRQQFSNEKILEDELTARIEAGISVFGLQLKVYKRHGEYGRQYIIPIGRLDLLCEDKEGNLYVIELKKDSGYDDAYKQTADYLDWFEKNKISKGKKVYGIICLNNPTKELIEKVHADSRMKLYEYQVSYTEI